MIRDFRFRVQKLVRGRSKRYQLRVGMDGERDLEFIPVHCSAYAQRFPLKEHHSTEQEAHQERELFIDWLRLAAKTKAFS